MCYIIEYTSSFPIPMSLNLVAYIYILILNETKACYKSLIVYNFKHATLPNQQRGLDIFCLKLEVYVPENDMLISSPDLLHARM